MNEAIYMSTRGICDSFEDVFAEIESYIEKDPSEVYKVMVGTDSQVHPSLTRFVTGIVVQRVGKGTWSCVKKVHVRRKITNLYERISMETTLTEEVLALFTDAYKNKLIDLVLPFLYTGAELRFEAHLDIGAKGRNRTREYVQEMVARIKAAGFEPQIKPHAFVASSYANRYTK